MIRNPRRDMNLTSIDAIVIAKAVACLLEFEQGELSTEEIESARRLRIRTRCIERSFKDQG